MAAASRMLIHGSSGRALSWSVRQRAGRGAGLLSCLARLLDGPVGGLGQQWLGTSSIWSSPIWNHSAAASRMRARAWSTVLPRCGPVAPLRARRTSAVLLPFERPYRCARSPLSSCCRWSLGEPPRAEAGLKVRSIELSVPGSGPGWTGSRLAVTARQIWWSPLAHGLAASLPQLADQHPGGHRCSLSA